MALPSAFGSGLEVPPDHEAGQAFGGGNWFIVLGPYPQLANVYIKGHLIAKKYREIKTPTAQLKARALYAALTRLEDTVKGISVKTAEAADVAIKARLEATRKRPAGTPGPHLAEFIESRWLPTQPYDLGIVGVGDTRKMDQVVNPFDPDARPYWRALEFGSSHNVGRRVRGAFMPGGARPDPEEGRQRVHPYFMQGAANDFLMTIRRPIEPHRFLSKGARDAENYRLRQHIRNASAAARTLEEILLLGFSSRVVGGRTLSTSERRLPFSPGRLPRY